MEVGLARFLPRDAMLARYMLAALWPGVRLCLSVCVCHKSVFYQNR